MKRFLPICLLAISVPCFGQNPDINALMEVSSLNCTFPLVAQVAWKVDTPTPVVKKQEFEFQIAPIDLTRSSATIVGQLGSTNLLVIKGADVVNFIERTPLGVLNITSVFASRDTAGRFKAVHSRHLSGGIALSPFPSQNYGSCEAK